MAADPRRSTIPWSSASHQRLAAVAGDPDFLALVMGKGYSRSQIQGWIANGDVPTTYRGEIRALVDGWGAAAVSR